MSKFFKALEQAEHDRALRREQPRQPEEKRVAASPAPSREATPAAVQAPPPSPPAHRTDRRSSGRIWTAAAPRRPDRAEAPWGEIEEHLVSLLDPASPDSEQYRALRLAVEQLHRSADLSVVAVSSPTVGDGKTTTAINLAGALAQDPQARVLLIDADLRRACVGDRMGLRGSRERGLVGAVLDPDVTLDDVVHRRPPYNLAVLPAGRRPSAPYEVLKSPRFGNLLDQARQQYDFIVLDTPPVVITQDCRVITKWVDGFLLVVAADKTPAKLVEEALNRMEPSKIVGFVFNDDARWLSRYYAYGYVPSENGNGAGWLRRAMTRIAAPFRQRPA